MKQVANILAVFVYSRAACQVVYVDSVFALLKRLRTDGGDRRTYGLAISIAERSLDKCAKTLQALRNFWGRLICRTSLVIQTCQVQVHKFARLWATCVRAFLRHWNDAYAWAVVWPMSFTWAALVTPDLCSAQELVLSRHNRFSVRYIYVALWIPVLSLDV